MAKNMTASERVHAALEGEAVDRVPFCFWHHFRPQGSGEKLAELTKEFFCDKFQLDIVKIMPDLPYPEPEELIIEAEQMRILPRLELETPMFQEQLRCIRSLRSQIGDNPLILTLFSPFTYAWQFMGKELALKAVRNAPGPLSEGLGTIASNLRRLMEAAIEAGADGIFFSCMGATSADLSPDEYRDIARPFDLQALQGASKAWLNIVHVHAEPNQAGDEIYFNLFTDYPVSALSWSDRLTGPSLSEALSMTDKCLMGGLDERGPLVHGSETELENEMLSAISQTHGKRLILANGCSIPDDTSEYWLHTARRLIDAPR
jgi:uroporphyrinogen decarboxylase